FISCFFFFFFSSRRRHTRFSRDWSSDVCSSDLAVFTLCWQIALGGQLGPAVATALFALSLPMQGLWWLGKRSVTPLPPSILQWVYDVRGKLQEAGQALAPVEGKPAPQALADTLKRAFEQLDKTFLADLYFPTDYAYKEGT